MNPASGVMVCRSLNSKVEISHLKARQNVLQEQVDKLQLSAQSAAAGPALLPVSTSSSTATSSSPYMSRPSASHQGFHGDEVDLSDVLWSQQEINRLSTEVTRLEAEVAHWRRVSQVRSRAIRGIWLLFHTLVFMKRVNSTRRKKDHHACVSVSFRFRRLPWQELETATREKFSNFRELLR